MNTLRTKIALGVATLAVAAAGFAPMSGMLSRRLPLPDPVPVTRKINEYEGQHFTRKINEYEGQHFAKKGSFDITESEDQSNGRKVNEYEGQHFAATGKHIKEAILT